jgi:hypothetical protein
MEGHHTTCFDQCFLARLGVTARAWRFLAQVKNPEAREFYVLAAFQGQPYLMEEGIVSAL